MLEESRLANKEAVASLKQISKTVKDKDHTVGKYSFLIIGLLTGFLLNSLMNILLAAILNFYWLTIIALGVFGLFCLYFWLCRSLSGLTLFKKIRLALLGIGISSFLFALADIFNFTYGSNILLISLLGSIVLGCFSSIFERLLDIWERNEL